ncbi:hypothetical protein [Streptomyces sp. NPDC046909]|uniref:hypothetical protein n=1 Tax=Streptomyces sp. NPDC046909 TaxID=3155617 RepID=UPI0033DC9423
MYNATRTATGVAIAVGAGIALLGAAVLPAPQGSPRNDRRTYSVVEPAAPTTVRPVTDPRPLGPLLLMITR